LYFCKREPLTSKDSTKKWHIYFRLTCFFIITTILILSTFSCAVCYFYFINDMNPPRVRSRRIISNIEIYQYLRFIQSNVNNVLRYSLWGLIIERLFATTYRSIYEHHRKIYVFIIIFAFPLVIEIIQRLIIDSNKLKQYEKILFIFFDMPAIICNLLLYLKNRKLNLMKKNLQISLAERYQITENVLLIYLMLPIITIYGIQQLLTHAAALFCFVNRESEAQLFLIIVYAIRGIFYNYCILTIIFFKRVYVVLQKKIVAPSELTITVISTLNNPHNLFQIRKKCTYEQDTYFKILNQQLENKAI
uniref:G_PROTEIN_RECEP_F1_2 domain-containing protein n=1 Tax=Rhabditophanes sp. KR3021 TaxID=114890 RepID=A0AC35TNJ4_9BILA